MRCRFCSAPLPKSGLVCEYCGKRNPINLNSVAFKEEGISKGINCPICQIPLERIDIGQKESFIAHRCLKCDGIFFEKDMLEKMLDSYTDKTYSIDLNMLRFVTNHPRHEKEKEIIYKKCPFCQKTMQRKNYKSISGVIIDRCYQHGVWLDGGELKQLIEWKKAGGELKAKEYEKNKTQTSSFSYTPTSKNPFERQRDSLFDFDPLDHFFRWVYGF